MLMGWCNKDVTPLLTHWSYVFLALTHRYIHRQYIWMLKVANTFVQKEVSGNQSSDAKKWLHMILHGTVCVNTLRPRQNGRHFADDMFKWIFLNENVWIPIEISLKFVPKGSINNNPALFQIMAWRRPGDKPLSETMMVSSLTHICVTRPQWVKSLKSSMIPHTCIYGTWT